MRHCIMLAAVAALVACATRAEAGRFFCHHCGCCRNCKKICRLKCEKKEESKIEYVCECEDFCIPGPSKKCGVKTECDCDGHHRKILWQPTCARVHTRKKLVKKEVTKEVPDYKWVVEEYCCVCGHWVKVDREKDKDKKDKDKGPEKSGKSGGGSAKQGAADSDRPSHASPGGGRSQDNQSQGAGDQDDGDSASERLPLPPAERGNRQTRRDNAADAYRAYYYLDAESDARLNFTTVPEVRLNEPEEESRRLLLDLVGR